MSTTSTPIVEPASGGAADRRLPAKPRRGVVALVVRLVLWGIGAALGVVAVGLFLYTRPADARGARRAAEQQLAMALQPGEAVEHQAFVTQRSWHDYFRETHGLLAATDRRLLFVGVPPREIVSPERGPQIFTVKELPYERPITAERGRVFLGTSRGLVLRTGVEKETFSVAPIERGHVDQVLGTAERVQTAMREAGEREQQAQRYAAWLAGQPVYHQVQRGEALISIAARYGTTPELLQRWNVLTDDRVRIGQRLLVKPGA